MKMHAVVLLVLIFVRFEIYTTAPIKETSRTMDEEPRSVFLQIGYLNDDTIMNIHIERPKYGISNEKNITKSSRPNKRSIVVSTFSEKSNSKYPYGWKWNSTNLTYNVTLDYQPSWYEKNTVLNEIRAAFEYWTRESPLEFAYQPDGPVDITIRFTTKRANKLVDESFGVPHGLLAYTLNPSNGIIFLDISEEWTTNSSRGYSIFQVTAHEIGHTLGLDHSNDDASILQAVYPGNRKYFRTAPDDIRSIQTIYGKGKRSDVIDDKSPVYEEYFSFWDQYQDIIFWFAVCTALCTVICLISLLFKPFDNFLKYCASILE